MWFRKQKIRPPEQWTAPVIRFVGEQDGVAERKLKEEFSALFEQNASVRKAYLARVIYEDGSNQHVALCLAAPTDNQLNRAIGKIFGQMFNTKQHLDIFFLRDVNQESELSCVCRPFFEAETNDGV
ncbi:MAG TPA: enhanced serine sensitivity protein SseB C-terminal domain-containing protein [Pirellulales bacterium]|jgi:hypothetical protein